MSTSILAEELYRVNALFIRDIQVVADGNRAGALDGVSAIHWNGADEGDLVYVDLISIEPMTKVGTSYNGSVVTNYTETACVCYTTAGDEVWVYIDIDTYMNLFDSTADFVGDDWWADRIDFSSPVRIHGKMDMAEDLCEGLSYDIGSSLVIEFESKD